MNSSKLPDCKKRKGDIGDSDLDLTNGDSSFACDKCEQTFNSQQELKEHGRSPHQLL